MNWLNSIETVYYVLEKPERGLRNRFCKQCGESYYSWDIYLCKECAVKPTIKIEELW